MCALDWFLMHARIPTLCTDSADLWHWRVASRAWLNRYEVTPVNVTRASLQTFWSKYVNCVRHASSDPPLARWFCKFAVHEFNKSSRRLTDGMEYQCTRQL